MTKRVDTWMPLLVDVYLGDTTHLSTEQHGAYLLLLMAMWKRDGALPNDDTQLAAITRLPPTKWRAHRPVLMEFFTADGGRITQKRLASELANAKRLTEARAKAGAEGAAKRWQSDGKPIAKPSQNDASIPTPTTTSEPNGSGGKPPPDPVWHKSLGFLKTKGMPEAQARTYLGKLCRDYGNEQVLTAVSAAMARDPPNVQAYLMGVLKPKPSRQAAAAETIRGLTTSSDIHGTAERLD